MKKTNTNETFHEKLRRKKLPPNHKRQRRHLQSPHHRNHAENRRHLPRQRHYRRRLLPSPLATNPQGNEASIVCNWTDELLRNLMTNYKDAKDANYTHMTMFKDPQSSDSNRWLLTWGDDIKEPGQTYTPIRYIS